MPEDDDVPHVSGTAAPDEPDHGIAVLRARAAQTRRDRDAAIADLRSDLSDEHILTDFGIDLGTIED